MLVEELIRYGKENCHSDLAKILLADILNLNPLELLNHLDLVVEEDKCTRYKSLVKSIKEGTPIQYALGHVNFYGNEFIIDNRVLIPRFETEQLIEKTVEYINKYFKEPIDIIDLGCGSGVIGLTLEKKVSTNSVDLIDISKDALEITHKNCAKLNSKANIIESDMFSAVDKKYDLIISNPPYIRTTEEIEDIVKDNEPSMALYAGDDGLDCYRKILSTAKDHMKEKSMIAFEIGELQGDAIRALAHQYLDNIRIAIKKDLADKTRMVFIFKNCE